ncbi:MAG: peptide-methionine (S)-S-oxide reductase MsrA [Candidatus Nanohaloarchaea archaeon]
MESWKTLTAVISAALVFSAVSIVAMDVKQKNKDKGVDEKEEWKEKVEDREPKLATFAGGCFWCIEAVYQGEKGVESAVSGYAGGSKENATYDKVKTGETDHREAVQVEYYPSIISYKELLDMYWKSIDPTDPGGQFSDRGFQYTTAIYVHSEEQRRKAEESLKDLEESGKFDEPIVTKILNYTTFFPAEDYHQNYSRKNKLRYKAYKKASGREGFVEKLWNRTPLG